MVSPRICTPKAFTLIEILIVAGLLACIALLPLFADLSTYRGAGFRAERATIVTLLEAARADAINGIGGEPHGLALFPADNPHSYVLFAGADYTAEPATHEVFPADYPLAIAQGSPAAVIFAPLTGDADYTGILELIDPERGLTAEIDTNQEGMISW